MSQAKSTATAAFVLALLFCGCMGPLTLRGLHTEETADHTAKSESRSQPHSEARETSPPTPNPAPVVQANAALPPIAGLDAETNARVRSALAQLELENPQGCAAIKRVLFEQDSSIPPPMAQSLRDQCVAHLLANRRDPPAADGSQVAATAAKLTAAPAVTVPVSWNSTSAPASNASPAAATEPQPPAELPLPSPAPTTAVSQSTETAVQPAAATPAAAGTPAPPAATSAPAAEPTPAPAASTENTSSAQESPPVDPAEEEVRSGEWESQVRRAIDDLERELARVKHDEAEAARLNARLRLLYVIANRREQAVTPIEGLSEDEREFWKQQLYGLAVTLDAEGMHTPNRRATLALRYYDTAQHHLANMSSLDVRGLAFCSRVESYGRYEEFKSSDLQPGQEVLLYVEVDHFAAEAKGDQYETELQGEYEILDQQGVRVANVVLPLDKQLCNQRRRDYFIAYRLFIPKDLTAGRYSLRLTIEDVKGKKSSQSSIDFRVRG
jgi:hypothetical protein